jgi:TolA-binding protein
MTLTTAAGVALAAEPTASTDSSRDAKATDEVDAGTKKLLAAQGLYQRGLYKLAAQEYADFLSENPHHAQRTAALYALGLCQYRQNDPERAATLMKSALKDPAFAQRAEALAVLGQCELAAKRYDRAVEAFDELLARHADTPYADTAAINRLQAYFALNQYDRAADAARQYPEKYPRGAQRAAALYVLALAERASKHDDQAVAAADQLLKDHADSPYAVDAAMVAGQALEAQGKLDLAIEHYKRMLAVAPEARTSDAQYCLGMALYTAGKYDDSIAAFSSVKDGACAKPAALQLGLAQLAAAHVDDARATLKRVAADDGSARANAAKYGLARCDMAEKKFDSAREVLAELLRAQPAPANAAQVRMDRAVCAMELGKWNDAAGEFAAVAKDVEKGPQATEALYRQAYCLHRLKKFDASHAVCASVTTLPASEFTRASAELDAENLFQLAKYAEAGKAFAALAGDTKDEQRRLALSVRVGQCAYFAGDYDKAVELLEPLAKDPRVAAAADLQSAIFLLGDALFQRGKYADAADALARFVEISKGDTAEARFKLALARMRNNDDAGASKTLADLSKLNDESPWVQRGLVEYGQLLRKLGKGAQAEPVLKRVLAGNAPADLKAPATYLLAWVAFDAKRYAPAAALWKQLLDEFPKHALAPDAAYRRGVALKEAGEMDEAAAAVQAVADANPKSPDALTARQLAAACLSARGKAQEAEAVLASLAVDPRATDGVLYDHAWAQRQQKQPTEAAQTYQRLLKEHPDSKVAPAARVELAELLYDQKKYDPSVELLEAVIADKAADPKLQSAAYYRLGWCYQKLAKPAKAAEAFTKYDPKQAGGTDEIAASALLQAGLAYAETHRFDAAERALAAMLEQHPKNPQAALAMLRLGEVQAEQGKYEASGETYTHFLNKFAKDPLAPRAQFGIGWSLENRKKYEEARSAYKKVIDSSNGETAARAQFQIGETFLAESKFNQAIPALLAVEDVYAYPAWSARALVEAGRAFEELKQPDQARKQYEQVSNKYKDSAEADLARERLKAMAAK